MPQRVTITEGLRAKLGHTVSALLASLRPSVKLNAKAPRFQSLIVSRPYGRKSKGAELLEGRWVFGGQKMDVGTHGHPFSVSLPSERFAEWVHSFDWYSDLLAVPGGDAKAGQLAVQWASAFAASNRFVFSADLLARRTLRWGHTLSSFSDVDGTLLRRYHAQIRLLRRNVSRLSEGVPRLQAHASIVIYASRLVEKSEALLARALDNLDEEIAKQILPDGGHITRSPMASFQALDALLAADRVLEAAGLEGSRALDRAIDRLIPMIATLRHSDGGLGVFHGGHEGDPSHISDALNARGDSPQPFGVGPQSGYHRLEANGTIALIDISTVPDRPYDLESHLAPLAMEISTSEGRFLVNCGWHPSSAPGWRRPVRSSAAHSTLTLADNSPGEILNGGFLADVLGPAIATSGDNVQARRKEQDSGIWLECSHDGYKPYYGLAHRRRLFLGESGEDIRGEDSLYVPMGEVPLTRDMVPFSVRFHFHPDVRVSLAQDLSSALLVHKGKAGWRFRTDGGPLAVEPSVYLGAAGRPVRCQQLVVSGRAMCDGDGQGRENRVRWSLRRLKGRA